jgi:hypothetical protein
MCVTVGLGYYFYCHYRRKFAIDLERTKVPLAIALILTSWIIYNALSFTSFPFLLDFPWRGEHGYVVHYSTLRMVVPSLLFKIYF